MNKDVKIGLILLVVLLVAAFAYILKTRGGAQGSSQQPQDKPKEAQMVGGELTGTTKPAANDTPLHQDPVQPDPRDIARLAGEPGIPPGTTPEKTYAGKEEWKKILERIKSGNATGPPGRSTATHGNDVTENEGGVDPTGPSGNEGNPDPSAPMSEPKIYKALKGDTLSEISAKFYGTSRKWELILKANPDLITRPEDLRPDMELIIPVLVADPDPEPAEAGTVRTDPTLAGEKTYTVQKDDSYWMIAKMIMGSGTKFNKLFEANKGRLGLNSIDDPLKPGMVLVIPRD